MGSEEAVRTGRKGRLCVCPANNGGATRKIHPRSSRRILIGQRPLSVPGIGACLFNQVRAALACTSRAEENEDPPVILGSMRAKRPLERVLRVSARGLPYTGRMTGLHSSERKLSWAVCALARNWMLRETLSLMKTAVFPLSRARSVSTR